MFNWEFSLIVIIRHQWFALSVTPLIELIRAVWDLGHDGTKEAMKETQEEEEVHQ